MQSILAHAEEAARAEGATQIHVVRIRVGRLSGVVPEALDGAFEVMREGTMARQAALEIENVEPLGWCAQCHREFASPHLDWECPACGTLSREIRGGRDLHLASMEIS